MRAQTQIPGTERYHDEQLSKAAEDLHDSRIEKKRAAEAEKVSVDRLVGLMQDKGLDEYVDEELAIRVTLTESKVSAAIKPWKAPARAEDDAQGEHEAEAAE